MSHTTDGSRAYDPSNRGVLRVSLVYMFTGFIMFCAMGLLGLVMRLNHAGWWVIDSDWFYRIMTIHGTGMVAGMLLAAMGGMAAALSRSAKLSVRWLWTTYFVYSLSVPFLLYAVLVGGFAGGWTMLDPLPFHGFSWDKWAGVMMYLSAFWVGVGYTIYCVHVLYVMLRKFGGFGNALGWQVMFRRGPVPEGTPVPTATELSAAATSIAGIITGIAGLSVLLPLFAEAAGLVDHINPLYSKNFIMFFGHTAANLTIYISVGLVYALIPIVTGRGGHTSKLVAVAWNMTIILVVTPTSHHLYQDFNQPIGLLILGQVASWSIAPEVLLITIIGSLSHVFRSGLKWSVPSILIATGIWGWVFGGMAATIDASIPANNLMHNTLWVPGHFHSYYLLGVTTFVWGYLYYLIQDLSGIPAWASSKIAAWAYGIAGMGFVLMFFFSGGSSVPRRYAVHIADWNVWVEIAVPFVLLTIVSVLWMSADMWRGLGSAWRGTGPTRSAQ